MCVCVCVCVCVDLDSSHCIKLTSDVTFCEQISLYCTPPAEGGEGRGGEEVKEEGQMDMNGLLIVYKRVLRSGSLLLHPPLADWVHVSTAATGTPPLTTPLRVYTSMWAWNLIVWVWSWVRVLYSMTREILSQGKQSAMHEGGITRQE